MLCREIVKARVESLSFREDLRSAARRMGQLPAQVLAVCDDEGRVIGTLTHRDVVLGCVVEGRPPETPIVDVMVREVLCCHPEQDIARAHQLMLLHRESSLLCCEHDGRLVGIVALSDVASCIVGPGETRRHRTTASELGSLWPRPV